LQEHCTNIRIPETVKSDGDLTLLSAPVKDFLNQHVIHANKFQPENQQQNQADHASGTVKNHVSQMYPLAYKF
jgi:hypothetical protein